ncbi:MAG: PAS domain S-box protein [Chloroflexi bacterium]|nr:PAS domain S-box protein [Chloroflexota bacterium]
MNPKQAFMPAVNKEGSESKEKSALPRTAWIYLIFGVLWVLLSDAAAAMFAPVLPGSVLAQIFKGLLFVSASALLIHFVLQREVRKLTESEQRYKLLFENNPHPMWVYDLETLAFLMVNDAAIQQYGYTREEFLGMTIKDIRPSEELHALLENIAGRTAVMQSSSGWKHRKKDGSLIDVEISSHSMTYGGRPARLVLATDVTERRRTERALEESEERYRTLFEASGDAIVLSDLNANIVLCNQQAAEMLGLGSVDEIIGRSVFEFIVPEHHEQAMEKTGRVLERGQLKSFEFDLLKQDGSRSSAEASYVLLKNADGTPRLLLSIIRDITDRKRTRERLAYQAELLANVQDAIVGTDENLRVTYWNRAAMELFGWMEKEALGRNTQELFKAHVPGSSREETLEAFMTTGQFDGEAFTARKDGVYINAHIRSVTLKDSKGDFKGLVTSIRDITERKQAEMVLRRNEQILRDAQSIASLGSWSADLKARLLYASPEGARLVGWAPGVHKLEELLETTHPDDRERIQSAWMDAVEDVSPFDIEYRVIVDGKVRWLHVTAKITFDAEGKPFSAIGVLQDITERKQAEEQLRVSEERFRLLVENIEEGFWITDPFDGTELYLSPAIKKIWGRPPNELMEKPSAFLENILPEDRPIVLSNMEKQKEGRQTSMEYRIRRPDGSMRWIWDRAFPVFDENGKIKFITGLVTDITDRKAAEGRIRLHLQRLTALNEIDRAIGSSFDMRFSLEVLLQEALSQLKVDAACVLLLNPVDQSLEFMAGRGFHTSAIQRSRLRLGEGFAGQAGLERKVVHVPNLPDTGALFTRGELLQDEEFIEYFGVPLIAKGALKGVLEVFHRLPLNPDPDWLNFLETLGGQAAIAVDNAQLFEGIQKSNQELVTAYDATIAGWSHAMDLRDKETEGHTQRVTEITQKLAERMGISRRELIHIRRGALLHDIGKLGVPDHILLKPDKLTEEEWEIMKQHPTHAYKMLLSINYLRPALDIPYCHHEKWDGSGYPRGLKGDQIPLAARVFAIVDVWDALRSDRPYRPGWSPEKIRNYILEQSGKHFDPQVVETFLKMMDEQPELF